MSTTPNPMLNVAIRAARAAGAIINRAALDVEAVRVTQKQLNDFVTEIDHASEAAIIETLLGAYPGHAIWAEESGRTHGAQDSEYVWIIDPLDGTTNFIHGFPVYCVSIALAWRGRVEIGVVYDPTRNDLFTATRGRGAFLNDRRLRVSKRIHLRQCLIATGFPFRPGDDFQAYLCMMSDVMQRTAALRRPGAAALDLAYVAAGFSDGFFETGLSAWDVAAGSLLVTEAGGLIGNFTGEPDFLEQRECLAGNPKVYAQLVQVLKPYSRFASVQDKASVADAIAKGQAERSARRERLGAGSPSGAPVDGVAPDPSAGGEDRATLRAPRASAGRRSDAARGAGRAGGPSRRPAEPNPSREGRPPRRADATTRPPLSSGRSRPVGKPSRNQG